ncbi:hypothetical protein Ddc_06412 [Ditylenchus destructor]|nr:hypothetical protein Ddc_06412 [Ditylenchus destructor]
MGKPKERVSTRKPTNVPDDKQHATLSQILGYMPNRREIRMESQIERYNEITEMPALFPSEEYYKSPQQRLQYNALLVRLQNLFRHNEMDMRTSDTVVAHQLVEEYEKAYGQDYAHPPLKSYFNNVAHKETFDAIFRRLTPYTDHKALHYLASDIERMEELISEIDSIQKSDVKCEANN